MVHLIVLLHIRVYILFETECSLAGTLNVDTAQIAMKTVTILKQVEESTSLMATIIRMLAGLLNATVELQSEGGTDFQMRYSSCWKRRTRMKKTSRYKRWI